MKTFTANRIVWGSGLFLVTMLIVTNLPDDARMVVLPVILLAAFAKSAVSAQPIAIAILLYYSMILGGWLILAAAPVTVLLARRYQRRRMQLPVSHAHIRRSLLVATAALIATLPFVSTSLGPWSQRASSVNSRSASPLVGRGEPGDENVLQRLARWLGFGPDPGSEVGQGEPLIPRPIRPEQPDEPFNWWIVVFVIVVLALLALGWWLWRRRNRTVSIEAPTAAEPLARLEALGAHIGRPRRPFEGAITYARVLARQTGDARLAETGPLVSGEVYQSAFADPGRVDENLRGIEAAPPPPAPRPSVAQRVSDRIARSRISAAYLFAALAAIALMVIVVLVVVPRLGSL